MAMKGVTVCAVRGCGGSISGPNNLCDKHRLPGGVVNTDRSSMVVTCWKVTHGDEVGIIFLCDWSLGNLFGGREGFEAELKRQGFKEVFNLATEKEVDAMYDRLDGRTLALWSGPWLPEYPWKMN